MRTHELLSKLRSKDIEVWAEGDRLRYDAPKGSLTPDLREELVRRKTEVLALLRQADSVSSRAKLPLQPVSRDQPLVLSFAQQRLWFLTQLEPDQCAFNMAWAFELTGDLEVGALERALRAIVDRHEALRTTFAASEGDDPVQVIAPSEVVELEHVHLATLAPAERDAELHRQMGERARLPLDLANGPVLRTTLYQLEPEEHVLALTIHHIAFDGWSFGVLARELEAFYAAFVEGCEPALPAIPIQYADYAAWQRQWLQGEVLEAQIEYWRRQLGPELTLLELPTDHPRPAKQSFAGARESYALSASLLASLRSLSEREGATLFMTLVAGLKVLFHRYSGQSVITIGTPVANRTRSEIEPLIGFFVNSLVLSTELDGELGFREALARVREVSLGAYAHQDLPFEQLVEELRPQRDQSRHPLFQVMFALQNVPFEPMELPGLRLSAMPVERSSSQFDLALFAHEGDGELRLIFEYSTDLFERKTIRRMLGHFETLLAGAVADPEQAISRLPMLGEVERQQLLVDWNATEMAYAREVTVAEQFEAQVAATPDAAALVFGEDTVTYAELNTRANCLAQHLRQQGVGPENVVGVLLPRSIDFVIGLLGILKAGGAYLPIDPALPPDRIAFMVNDAQASVVVTQTTLENLLPTGPLMAVCLDAEADRLGTLNETDLAPAARASNLAYVIYTSGSTGSPKGVEITHVNLLNLVGWHQRTFEVVPSDRATQVAGLSFDATVWELWPYLLNGASVVLAPDEEARTLPERIRDWLVAEGITVSFLPTPVAESVLSLPWPASTALRFMLTGGDQLHQHPAANLPFKLVNNYGPTESTVVTTSGLIEQDSTAAGLVPPIGRPIANTQAYVLDAAMQPVPVGVYGELYVGGEGLARGYLQRPALTAEKFVPHPFSDAAGARLYRTGDLVRYRAEGAIEFLGRQDHQVKVRGFRIELGEIEAALTRHPDIAEAVALVREGAPGEKRLVAYVVPVEAPLSPVDLRQFLKQSLPEYMLPAAFVMLEALPLTPNGKLDRRALPEPDGSVTGLGDNFVGPRNPTEATLAKNWQKLLGIPQVGVHDNFFELGGHSLLATRVVSQIKQEFHVDLSLAQFFDAPTISELAEGLEGLLWISAGRPSEDGIASQEVEEGEV